MNHEKVLDIVLKLANGKNVDSVEMVLSEGIVSAEVLTYSETDHPIKMVVEIVESFHGENGIVKIGVRKYDRKGASK